jgi:multidrug efflux pump
MVQVNLNASTNLHTLTEFQNLVIKQNNGAVVRLKDVAKVTLGDDDYESQNFISGRKSVFIGIQVAPTANLLEVLKNCRKAFNEVQPNFPEGFVGDIGFDTSDFVNSAISEVVSTLIEAALIVTVVVFAFLGSLRSVLIPTVTIPLSLVGTLIAVLWWTTPSSWSRTSIAISRRGCGPSRPPSSRRASLAGPSSP